jgi:multisubunit Na+/H+ antiporter MnhB subunit
LKFATPLALALFAVLLLYGVSGLPNRGNPYAPEHREISAAGTPGAADYYTRNAYRDAHTPNIVTVILADYRGYDTMGETTVIFTAGIICYLILRKRRS